jgi:hypothetical protein
MIKHGVQFKVLMMSNNLLLFNLLRQRGQKQRLFLMGRQVTRLMCSLKQEAALMETSS